MCRWLIGASVALGLALGLLLVMRGSSSGSAQPLAVIIQGKTSCVVSNQSRRTIKVWAAAYAEMVPFFQADGPDHLALAAVFKDAYLKPCETILFEFHAPTAPGNWRLMVPWSEGYRAKIRDTIHHYKFIPLRFRISPQYLAPSAVVKGKLPCDYGVELEPWKVKLESWK